MRSKRRQFDNIDEFKNNIMSIFNFLAITAENILVEFATKHTDNRAACHSR